MSRIRYRNGLKVASSQWEVVRDNYSLLDPSHRIPESPVFALGPDPFLLLWSRLGMHGVRAGIQQTDEGRKVLWFEELRDGQTVSYGNPDSIQQLLHWIDLTLANVREFAAKNAPRKKR